MSIIISSQFDGGNIIVNEASDPSQIHLSIRRDNNSDFFQWFYYHVSGAKNADLRMIVENAGDAAYPKGWENYRACASFDRKTWFRVDTDYKDGQLIINHRPEADSIYYAYFSPYSNERHNALIADYQNRSGVTHRVLGQSLDGRDMDCLSLGNGDKNIWVIARQHPGETMAQWWMEGFLARLTDATDLLAKNLLQTAQFHIVPNMCPDGSFRGHLRTNAIGVNLNREWGVATLDKSPEVYHVMKAMEQNSPSLCLDVHGDEALPYNFIAGTHGIPDFTDELEDLLESFKSAYVKANPEFQTRFGYPRNPAGQANLTLCSNYIAQTYNCLAMTLEMPFKDNADRPDPIFGWSPKRSQILGAAVLGAMADVVDRI